METKVRYVVKTAGNTKLTPKTLNMDGSDDPFYRYKMRELYIQVVGKGKMIKTVLLNVDDVAKDLKVPPAYMTAYLGYALNAQTKYDAKKPDRERASISGDIDAEKMSQRIVDFMKEFVLCPKCKLPEITHSVDKKSGDVLATCRSCGEHSTLHLKDNFQRYINNHPHHFTVAKEETAVRKKQEAHAKEAAKQTEKEKEAAENAAAAAERKEKRRKAKEEEANDDDDVSWSADVSSDAVRARRRELLPAKLASLVVSDIGDQPPVEIDFVAEVRKYLETNPEGDVIAEARRIKKELALDDATFLSQLFTALFDTPSPNFTKPRILLLKKVVTGTATQKLLLENIEKIAASNADVKKKVMSFIKSCYDNDILDEEVILQWHAAAGGDAGVKAAVKKLIEWLQNAEEDDE